VSIESVLAACPVYLYCSVVALKSISRDDLPVLLSDRTQRIYALAYLFSPTHASVVQKLRLELTSSVHLLLYTL